MSSPFAAFFNRPALVAGLCLCGPALSSGQDAASIGLEALRGGRYDETIATVEEYRRENPEKPGLGLRMGMALMARGRWEEAERELEGVISGSGQDGVEAALELGKLRLLQGRREEAEQLFASLLDAYNRRASMSAPELLAVGEACRLLGSDDPALFKDALRAFDEAIAKEPSWPEPRIAVGELFLEKYNGTEARGEIEAALALDPSHPRGLLAMAKVLHFEGSYVALEAARKSLESNPNSLPARVLAAQLLLEIEDFEAAEAEARLALEVNPRALEARAVLAATHFLRGDLEGFGRLEAEVLALNPQYAEFYNLMADASVRNRFYRQAAEFGRRAVELDPKSWRGLGLQGLNELRVGEIEEGRDHLEESFAGDPYNVWIKNTLDLVDTYEEYEEHPSQRFRLVAHEDEAGLLAPYALDLAEEAYDALAERYRFEPSTPIRLEFYPSHADFSVRTIGLAGMGALGVCFGSVIAQDSPRARPAGAFNWGSTLWHELAHTFTLEVSEHRVPRWLTEGLSVLEERRARVGWGDDLSVDFLTAWRDGELLGIAEINNGFVRPTFPEQIGISYYQASLASELIERDWGFDALLALLHGYRDNKGTVEIFDETLGLAPEDFDERFEAFLEQRFGGPRDALAALDEEPEDGGLIATLSGEPGEAAPKGAPRTEVASGEEAKELADENPENFAAQLGYGLYLFDEDRAQEAVPYLERAGELFPQYAAADSPYRLLAKIYRDEGELEKAAAELRALTRINESDYDSRIELADLEEELGSPSAAVETLESAIFVYPYEEELHRRMARLYSEAGSTTGVVRARSALVALRPTDMAKAYLDLALAHFEAGNHADARREVLRALEIAPAYEDGQRLLLRIHRLPAS